MARILTVLFRRDPSRDREADRIHFEGYQMFWPDGRPVGVGLDGFCKHGQRALGLGRQLAGCTERLVELLYFPLKDRDDDLVRLPGQRVRRFYLERQGELGRVHFLDGTPTATVFDLNGDEPCVLDWLGLPGLRDGEQQWFDFTTRPVQDASQPAAPRRRPVVAHRILQGNGAV